MHVITSSKTHFIVFSYKVLLEAFYFRFLIVIIWAMITGSIDEKQNYKKLIKLLWQNMEA